MAFTKITNAELNSRGATTLPNVPTIGATALKQEFDAPAKQVVAPKVNNLIDELQASTAAADLGAVAPTGRTGTSVQSVLNSISSDLGTAEAQSHAHPNKAVIDKFADDGTGLTYDGNPVGAVTSVNSQTGAVVLTASDVGALPSTTPIPTKTSDLTNDSGFITASSLPTKTSQLTNDSGFITSGDIPAIPTKTSDLTNDSNFVADASYVHTDNNYDATAKGIVDGATAAIAAKSTVAWNQNITTGQKIATVTIDGTPTDVYAPTGGGMLPYLYIDSEAGATVTIVQPDSTTIIPTAAGSGHWECELTGGYGTYVIHLVLSGQGDATLSLAVDTVKEYHVPDTHYDYTINVTAPSGSTVRIVGGGETYTGTGTGSSQAFAVHTASTAYTVAVTMDGNTKSETITSAATSGQSGSVTIAFGTINLTYANDFRGKTITCTKSGVTVTKTAPSSGNTMTLRVPTTGTWTISGVVSGQTYSVNANVTSLSTAVSANLQTKAPMYSFETATDAQLAAMLDSYYRGLYDATDISTLKSTYMPIGAKRTIHLSRMAAGDGCTEEHFGTAGADYQFTIIGFEHDDLVTQSSGGKTKALLTLQQDRILYKNTTDSTYSSSYPSRADGGGQMNTVNTNVGGWKECPRRAWCNNTYFNALPAAIRNLVKTVSKLSSKGNQQTAIDATDDNVFLLSEHEIFGAKTYSVGNEGNQYDYYKTAANRYKKPSYSSYSSARWWERSPYLPNASDFCSVSRDGNASYGSATYAVGLAPAFCI